MDVVKLSTGSTGYPDAELTKSNVVSIRPLKTEAAAVASTPTLGDRFTASSAVAEGGEVDGVADTLTLGSATGATSADWAREARVARVIAAVQNGTYHMDTRAVAGALVSRVVTGSAEVPEE